MKQRFQTLLYQLATGQAESIIQDKPTHKFIRKFYALLESGKVCVLDKNRPCDFIPQSCVGYEDDEFYYLYSEVIHKEVRKLCDEQGESFTVSQKSLQKMLAEEGFIETASGQNTKQVRIGKRKCVCSVCERTWCSRSQTQRSEKDVGQAVQPWQRTRKALVHLGFMCSDKSILSLLCP